MSSADPCLTASSSPAPLPSASIIIPVHNKATITRQCLDALLAEPDDGIERELIVVNDGSSDLTQSVLASYGSRIRVVHNETALGFAGACNAGVAAATGEFLVLLNNDTIPTAGWLANLVAHAVAHPEAAVVGVKLLFPNDTIQHAGVVFGLDLLPHHIYIGFPADHPATAISRRFQVVTAACALFRREPWQQLGGLDTAFRNGWEDVDFCLRAGEAGFEVHYCAESVLYHLESATRDLLSTTERGNQELFRERWRDKIVPDDFGYYWMDGLLSAHYGARYPIQISVSPHLAGVAVGENERLADKLLYDRSRQVMILLRNNIVLNVRVQEAEARAASAEQRLASLLAADHPPREPHDGRISVPVAAQTDEPLTESRHDGMADVNISEDLAAGANALPDTEAFAATGDGDPDTSEGPPLQPALHKITGRVESPGSTPDVITDGILIVSGWATSQGQGVAVTASIDGQPRGDIAFGVARPDVASLYPELPEGENCGFMGEVPVADLCDGLHTLVIRFDAPDGDGAELSTTFEVDNHAYESGRLLGRLDTPIRGAKFLSREIVQVSGWALARSGIQTVESFIDGQPVGSIIYGSLRPDIARIRRRYANADHCGFYGSISMFGIAEGPHELTVKVTANDGRELELATRLEVDNESVIDAGLPLINKWYETWLRRAATAASRGADTAVESESFANCPLIELVFVPERDSLDALEALAESMIAQVYPNWRLTIADYGAAGEGTYDLARQLADEDARFELLLTETRHGAAAAWSEAALLSKADFIGFLRDAVILSPDALSSVARSLANDPGADIIYSDDDRVDPQSTVRWNPFFKPDWSPDLLLSMSYLGPLVLFRRSLAIEAGALRAGFSGAEVYDLTLRVAEHTSQIRHLPHVLATTIESAPAPGVRWPGERWIEMERLALRDAMARRGVHAIVERGLHPGRWRIRYPLDSPPHVTAVLPTGGNLELLRPCLDDLLRGTNYPKLDILVVDNSTTSDVERLVSELSQQYPNVRRISVPIKPFNYSALINAALPHVDAPYVLLLNDDISVIEADWLSAMVEHAARPEVGIVGAKLLYPDDTIQHAGVVLGPFAGSVHVFKRYPAGNPGFFDLPDVVRNCSAVTFACALIDRAVFDEIGGLDEVKLPVAFNDTDFCLRARDAGFDVLYTPHATLYHHESVTKTVIAHPHEIEYLRERWGHVIAHDPYYNPNLTRNGDDASLNMEPVKSG
jgi:GT2 family glycosyltransferase